MKDTITKSDLAKLVSEKTKKSQKESNETIDTLFDVISDNLSQGKEINITGFGKFHVSNRAARNGINPQTKEKIKIPASKLPSFKAGKVLKEKINK